MSSKEDLRNAAIALVEDGQELHAAFVKGEDGFSEVALHYQDWYTKSLSLVRLLAPDRIEEFESYYRIDPRRRSIDSSTYSIQDYLVGTRPYTDSILGSDYDASAVACARFFSQYQLLGSLHSRLDGVFANIEGTLAAEFEDRELSVASDLLDVSVRAAGAVAGVVLESHLQRVCESLGLKIRRKRPTIADYNESLKTAQVIDVPVWRKIQYLADIRNLCTHKKEREPSAEEASALIEGVAQLAKTLH